MARTPFWKLFLDEVTSDHTRHFLWLKSLSYLEYIGYRKMIKSLHHGDVGKGVYHHLTDEIRHSFMLNELAHKTFPSPALPEPQAWEKAIQEIAEDYFQNIDGETEAWVWQTTGEENSLLCYMLVSYLVEKRAMNVYPSYFHSLREAPCKHVVQRIIQDESEHLAYLEERLSLWPAAKDFLHSPLWEHEHSCFDRYLQGMHKLFSISLTKSLPER